VKLLLDANLSPEVARILKEAGHDAIHVADIGLLSAPDFGDPAGCRSR
jgi:predicted nuclease of predicted toxin-antitoxin system